jgi:hypothetical protein
MSAVSDATCWYRYREQVCDGQQQCRSECEAWDDLAVAYTRGDDRDEHRYSQNKGDGHNRAAHDEQHTADGLNDTGDDLHCGRPRQPKAAKRVKLPVMKRELHQASDEENEARDDRDSGWLEMLADPPVRRGDHKLRHVDHVAGSSQIPNQLRTLDLAAIVEVLHERVRQESRRGPDDRFA